MKPLRFLSLVSLGLVALTVLAFKDFRGSKIAVVSLDKLARERAELLAKRNLKAEAMDKAIQRSIKTLNKDLEKFASDKKVILFTTHTLKGGADDLTEEFKAYASSKKRDKV